MNKKTKGLVAAGIGTALLLGSAGTFALWWDQATIDDDGIVTGDLAISDAELSAFIRTASFSTLATGTLADLGTEGAAVLDYLVPGDTAEAFVTNSFLTLAGESIRAELTIDGLDEAVGEAPVLVTLVGGTEEEWVFPLINNAGEAFDQDDAVFGDYQTWSAVFSAAEVDAFNAFLEAGIQPILRIEFPATWDGEEPNFETRENFWGRPDSEEIGDNQIITDGGRNMSIVLRDNVQLIFVQTGEVSTLEAAREAAQGIGG